MELTPEIKQRIDEMAYVDLLRRWRFAPAGDAMFQGEVGDYYARRMNELRGRLGGAAMHTAASKEIGWER